MGSTFPTTPHYYNIIITMNYSVLAVVLLSLGSVLATPAFLKDVDQCEELNCCPTTTTVTTTTTTESGETTSAGATTTESGETTTAGATTTGASTTTTGAITTTTTGATTTTTGASTTTTIKEVPPKAGTTMAPTTTTPGGTTTTTAPTCQTLNCNCGGGDDGESSGANHVLPIAVLAAGFFLSFLL